MSNKIKQTIKREYLNCAQSPVHFMKKYCKIQHPTKGKIKFDLYDFQEAMLTDFKENQYNIILKSRQLGISTLSAFIRIAKPNNINDYYMDLNVNSVINL